MAATALAARHQLSNPAFLRDAALTAGLLAAGYLVVYLAGGTRTALPHLFYVPVLYAAVRLGRAGALLTALLAAVLCGPLMPMDTTTGLTQDVANWGARGLFFIGVGGFAGIAVHRIRQGYELDLTSRVHAELVGEPNMDTDPQWRQAIEATIANSDFDTVFQPIYSLRDGALFAVEALTRFRAEPHLTPDVWFTRAAQAGLGVDLELATMRKAFEQSPDLEPGVWLSVNVSPDALADERLLELLDQHSHQLLIVELTEHSVVTDYPALEQVLGPLRERGVQIAIDDAGAGFASLRHIVKLSPHVIKLDHSLTQDLRHDAIRRALANALIQFAHDTGSVLIAEGIEKEIDLTAWQDLGAFAAQGYLLARPGPLPAQPLPAPLKRRLDSPDASAGAQLSR